jgi:hypothetical protein
MAYGIASDNQAIVFAIHDTDNRLRSEQGLKPSSVNAAQTQPRTVEAGRR